MLKKICIMFLAGLLLTGCMADNKEKLPAETTTLSAAETTEKEIKETFRYASKDYFYTDFEGESVVQTDTEIAYTICQRNLHGELTDSYYMGENFVGIFYIDENWLYYSECNNKRGFYYYPESVYRAPLSHKNGKEIPLFSKKEFLFTEPDGLSGSDFIDNSFIQIVDNTIYYCAGSGLGTYNLESKEQKYYPVPEGYIMAAGTRYMAAEGEKQCSILVNLETGKSKVMKTDRHPWLRLGKELYLRYPYISRAGDILLDLNSGKTIEVLSYEEGVRLARETGVPLGKKQPAQDDMYIEYIGYYNHRLYVEIHYTVTVKDKNGRKITAEDAVCASRNMDEEESWTVEKEITEYYRKKIIKFYKQVKAGNYKKKHPGELYGYSLEIGEGIANGIFYFNGYYNKNGKMAIDIYDLEKNEFRVIGRNSPETFYPFYDNSNEIMDIRHSWQNIRCTVPIMDQGEDIWEQKQKRSGKYYEY